MGIIGVFGSSEVHGGLDYRVIVVGGHFVVGLVISILVSEMVRGIALSFFDFRH